jgi:hypothetical protein
MTPLSQTLEVSRAVDTALLDNRHKAGYEGFE